MIKNCAYDVNRAVPYRKHDAVPFPVNASANPVAQSLTGIRILDFSQIAAGPFCTMLLADMGADVIKVEPPQGDVGRSLGPTFVNGESATFLALNRNKRSIVIDLKHADDRELARNLVASADVIVESFRPGVMRRFGLDHGGAKQINPNLIYCSISAFGQSGPWAHRPGVDGALQAISGVMSITGAEGDAPSKLQAPVVDMTTGYQACIAILAALRSRAAGQVTKALDVNLYSSALMLQQIPLTSYLASGDIPIRCGSGAPYATPNEAYETADGHLMVAAYQESKWRALCAAIGRPGLVDDPRFANLSSRIEHRTSLTSEINAAMQERTSSEWLNVFSSADIVCFARGGLSRRDRFPPNGRDENGCRGRSSAGRAIVDAWLRDRRLTTGCTPAAPLTGPT